MIPFLCVQLDPRGLFKTKALHSGSEGTLHSHLLWSCPSLPFFLQKQLKCFVPLYGAAVQLFFLCCVESTRHQSVTTLITSTSTCEAFRTRGPCFPLCWDFWSPVSSSGRHGVLIAHWSSWFFFHSHSLSSDLIVCLLLSRFTDLTLASAYSTYPSACRPSSPCTRSKVLCRAPVPWLLLLFPASGLTLRFSRLFIRELPIVACICCGFCSLICLLKLLRFSGSLCRPSLPG